MLSLLEKAEVLDTYQIWLLFFVSLRMAQKRLTRLYERKKIKRAENYSPYCYYLDKRPGQIEHRIGVNWIYVWGRLMLRSWEKFHGFEWEVTFSKLRSDGLVIVKNIAHNALEFSFVEFDIVGSGNSFDKVVKYNWLYESGEWLRTWWGPLATGFPRIVVVTTGTTKRIQDLIDRDNRNGLEFVVRTYESIKEECLHGHSSSSGIRA